MAKNETNYIVYRHTAPDAKVYIGITKQKPEMRWANGKGYKSNPYFTNAIKNGLIGTKAMCVEEQIIFDNITEAQKWIKQNKGIDGVHIKDCCSNNRQTCGGYHWKFVRSEP